MGEERGSQPPALQLQNTRGSLSRNASAPVTSSASIPDDAASLKNVSNSFSPLCNDIASQSVASDPYARPQGATRLIIMDPRASGGGYGGSGGSGAGRGEIKGGIGGGRGGALGKGHRGQGRGETGSKCLDLVATDGREGTLRQQHPQTFSRDIEKSTNFSKDPTAPRSISSQQSQQSAGGRLGGSNGSRPGGLELTNTRNSLPNPPRQTSNDQALFHGPRPPMNRHVPLHHRAPLLRTQQRQQTVQHLQHVQSREARTRAADQRSSAIPVPPSGLRPDTTSSAAGDSCRPLPPHTQAAQTYKPPHQPLLSLPPPPPPTSEPRSASTGVARYHVECDHHDASRKAAMGVSVMSVAQAQPGSQPQIPRPRREGQVHQQQQQQRQQPQQQQQQQQQQQPHQDRQGHSQHQEGDASAAIDSLRAALVVLQEENANLRTHNFDLSASLVMEEAEQSRLRQDMKKLESEKAFMAQEVREADRIRARAEKEKELQRQQHCKQPGAREEMSLSSGSGNEQEGMGKKEKKRRIVGREDGLSASGRGASQLSEHKEIGREEMEDAGPDGRENETSTASDAIVEENDLHACEEALAALKCPVPSTSLVLQSLVESLCLLLSTGTPHVGRNKEDTRQMECWWSSAFKEETGHSQVLARSLGHNFPTHVRHFGKEADGATEATGGRRFVSLSAFSSSGTCDASIREGLTNGDNSTMNCSIASSMATQLYLSLWPISSSLFFSPSTSHLMPDVQQDTDMSSSMLLPIIQSLGAMFPHVHALGTDKVVAALRVARCLLSLCPGESREMALVSGGHENEGENADRKGDKDTCSSSFMQRFQGSKVDAELLRWAATGGMDGEGARQGGSGNKEAIGSFLNRLLELIDWVGEHWKDGHPSYDSTDPSFPLLQMTSEALAVLLVLCQERNGCFSSLGSFGFSSCWATAWLRRPTLPLLLEGALRARHVELVDLCLQLTHALSQQSPRLFQALAGLKSGAFLSNVACQVFDWHLESMTWPIEGKRGRRARSGETIPFEYKGEKRTSQIDGCEMVPRKSRLQSPTSSPHSASGLERLCLRMTRFLSRVCISYGTSAVHVFLHAPLLDNEDKNYSLNHTDTGMQNGHILARLVGVVHQAIHRLLRRTGNPSFFPSDTSQEQWQLQRMLARESFELLSLLSANNPAGLSAGLDGSGCRWTLEAVNFRLMNSLVEGLEDLTDEAENLHMSLQ